MFLSLTRSCGAALLACLAAVSSVRGQEAPSRSSEAAGPRQSGVTDSAAAAPADPSRKEKTESSQDDLFASLGVQIQPHVLALAQIRARMRASVEQMPNYTCQESIRRERTRAERHGGRATKLRRISSDKVRVDVAFVDRGELYSWPGADRFEETPLSELVGFGMLSTGDFASIARTLFVDRNGRFSYVGEVDFAGSRALRYDFRVPLFRSGYSIHHETGDVEVEYGGAIWADADTKDLIRIETRVEDAPPPLMLSGVINQLDYERVRIGGKDFQLPKRAYLETHYRSGERNHNRIEFSNCRQFGAQSELSFTESDDEPAAASPASAEEFSLPPGVSVRLRLETEIDSKTSYAGDELRATVTRAVTDRDDVLLPKGAVVIGRLRRIERFFEPNNYFIVGLSFNRVEFDGKWAHFTATMTAISKIPGLKGEFAKPGGTTTTPIAKGPILPNIERRETFSGVPLEDTAELDIPGKRVRISAGHRMVWTTRYR